VPELGRSEKIMFRLILLLIVATVILTGCGKKLSGRYEAVAEIPRFQMPGEDAKAQKHMADLRTKIQEMNHMILEFDGSKVRMGSASAISEYSYRIDGNRLEIIAEAMGQKSIMPMTIEPDGSITYLTMHFHRTK
jgi:hypothetical protein